MLGLLFKLMEQLGQVVSGEDDIVGRIQRGRKKIANKLIEPQANMDLSHRTRIGFYEDMNKKIELRKQNAIQLLGLKPIEGRPDVWIDAKGKKWHWTGERFAERISTR